ncbi:hypothetical protein POSPLADRAFT_1158867, partial [Postia placenta MAD-698-R-SB12]
TFPSSPHPSWLPVKAKFTPSTLRTSSTSTSQMALRLSSSPASSSRAPIGHPDRSNKTTHATRFCDRSEGPNIRSAPAVPTHLNLPCGTLTLSPLAPAFPKLSRVDTASSLAACSIRPVSLALHVSGHRDNFREPSSQLISGGKPKSGGRPTNSHRSDGERCSNLRLGTIDNDVSISGM